jgi:hypothetical protein
VLINLYFLFIDHGLLFYGFTWKSHPGLSRRREALILRKSRLFEFRDFETAPTDLFVRYLANEPVGNTKQLLTSKATEGQQLQSESLVERRIDLGNEACIHPTLRSVRSGVSMIRDYGINTIKQFKKGEIPAEFRSENVSQEQEKAPESEASPLEN